MTESWTLLVALHAAGASLAVLLGALQVLRPRKGDLLHRRIGHVWMAAMFWVAFSSFGIQRLNPGHLSWIHALSAWTIVTLSLAIRAARRGDVAAHRRWATGSYLGLLGAGIRATAVPDRLTPQTAVHATGSLLAAGIGVTAMAILVVVAAARLPEGRRPALRSAQGARARTDAGNHLERQDPHLKSRFQELLRKT